MGCLLRIGCLVLLVVIVALAIASRLLGLPGVIGDLVRHGTEEVTPAPAAATVSVSVSPTMAARATASVSPAMAAYLEQAAPLIDGYAQAVAKLRELVAAAGRQPLLTQDSAWRAQITAAATALQQSAAQLAAIEPVPPELARFAALWREIDGEMKGIMTDLTRGIDEGDIGAFVAAAQRLPRLGQLTAEVAAETQHVAGNAAASVAAAATAVADIRDTALRTTAAQGLRQLGRRGAQIASELQRTVATTLAATPPAATATP